MNCRFASATIAAVAVMCFATTIQAQHHGGHCDGELQPLLDTPDFDGDGVVDNADVGLVRDAMQAGEYVAFFDANADEQLTGADVGATARRKGDHSSALDQEIASAFWATERYRNRMVAIQEGFIPFTPAFHGHGEHWTNPYDGRLLDRHFDPTVPEGLNYAPSGELVAVYYFGGPYYSSPLGTPEGFTGHEDHWHHHVGACMIGVDFYNPTYSAADLEYQQCIGPAQCWSNGTADWASAFSMVHLWLYKLNPCGRFGGTHPHVAMGYSDGFHLDSSCSVEDVLPAGY